MKDAKQMGLLLRLCFLLQIMSEMVQICLSAGELYAEEEKYDLCLGLLGILKDILHSKIEAFRLRSKAEIHDFALSLKTICNSSGKISQLVLSCSNDILVACQ